MRSRSQKPLILCLRTIVFTQDRKFAVEGVFTKWMDVVQVFVEFRPFSIRSVVYFIENVSI